MEDFVGILKRLLIEENDFASDDADDLIKENPDVVLQGMIGGLFTLRATAMALMMKKDEKDGGPKYA